MSKSESKSGNNHASPYQKGKPGGFQQNNKPDRNFLKMSLKVTFTLLDEQDGQRQRESGISQINLIDERNCSSPRNELNATDESTHFITLNPLNQAPEDGPFFFFDLDNTLYPKSSGIAELMVERIELFFVNYLKLPLAESRLLGAKFYRDYGLAIKGLIKHFSIDPLEYDRYVDGGLPLDDILTPSVKLTSLMDRLSKRGTCWVFTNAGKSHATRVLKLLQIDTFFSGIIYCDYSESNFPAKPDRLSFIRAMKCAEVEDPNKCFFFDDSIGNIRTAQEIGWNVVYIDEDSTTNGKSSIDEINASLEVIPTLELNEKTFPTIKYIEEVEKTINKLI